MGRQAKRKKQRQQPTESAPTQDANFMEQLQRQGYSPETSDRAPELPETRPEPQI